MGVILLAIVAPGLLFFIFGALNAGEAAAESEVGTGCVGGCALGVGLTVLAVILVFGIKWATGA